MAKIENIINKTSSQVGIYIGLFYMQIYLAYSITIKFISKHKLPDDCFIKFAIKCILLLILLFLIQWITTKIMLYLIKRFDLRFFNELSLEHLILFGVLITSVIFVFIIGIKDSAFEYIWKTYTTEPVHTKLLFKTILDTVVITIQCISIIFTYYVKYLQDAIKRI